MADTNLDEIDLKILKRLQEDGRITNVELANSVGLTAPPCLRRMRALEEEGVINSYHAAIDPAKMGYTITVFAMVSLKSQAEADLQAFEEHVQKLPEVREDMRKSMEKYVRDGGVYMQSCNWLIMARK